MTFCKWYQTQSYYISSKSIFHHEYEYRIVTSKCGSFWLQSNCKVHIARKYMPTIQVLSGNGGYHLEKEVEMSCLGPRANCGSSWRTAFCCHFAAAFNTCTTATNVSDWVVGRLGSTISDLFELGRPLHATRWWRKVGDRSWPKEKGRKKKRRIGERETMRKRGGRGGSGVPKWLSLIWGF